jgi:hypothetical protein
VRYSFSRPPIDRDRTQDLRAHYVFDLRYRYLSDVASCLLREFHPVYTGLGHRHEDLFEVRFSLSIPGGTVGW